MKFKSHTSLAKRVAILLVALCYPFPCYSQSAIQPCVITESTTFSIDAILESPILVEADNITINGNGATILGPGKPGDPKTHTGIGITAINRSGITIRNLKVRGFEIAFLAKNCKNITIENCDFSDNYHDPDHGWGDGNRNGGIILTNASNSTIRNNTANNVWNALDLRNCNNNLIEKNDFSHCSNVCLKLYTSSGNTILDNNLSYGLRMKPGEIHARDSTSVLIESGSNNNRFERNNITHGGDGVFIRPLNGWVSTGNIFIENDCSYANNNGFESWSPGNTYIRNRANHCSYGFWLGGSDNTVLIGNEAAHNGLPEGKHNAPESDFRHGGIVIVHGSGSHTLIEDNYCHHNNGGGIVFRGDLGTRGAKWKMFHLVVQNNRLEENEWGIFGRFTDKIFLAGNKFKGNKQNEFFEEVTNISRGRKPAVGTKAPPAPKVAISGPSRARPGETVRFAATIETPDAPGAPNEPEALDEPTPETQLHYSWDINGTLYETPTVDHLFQKPGFHRVSLTVDNGYRASLAFRDFYVVPPVAESATEGQASHWGWTMANNGDGRGTVRFTDDPTALVGKTSLRFRPDPYKGAEVCALFPFTKDAGWNLSRKKTLSFWLRFLNPNHGFQGPSIVRLHAGKGVFTYMPTDQGRPRNLLRDLPYPEARYGWLRVEMPLAGGDGWIRSEGFEGAVPPHYDNSLEFVTVKTSIQTQQASSLASAGDLLFCATVEGNRLFLSSDGREWLARKGPGDALGSHGDWINGMLAFWPGGGRSGTLILRHRHPEKDASGNDQSRIVLYDIETDSWTWTETIACMGHGSAMQGDMLFGLAHAIGPNYGGALDRLDLSKPKPALCERTAFKGMKGDNNWWLSRAAQLAALKGKIYGIKNDWHTPQPADGEKCGDRLFVFDPGDFVPSEFAGGERWKDANWKAAYTPIEDLGTLPFEIGHGAALVALPPRWCPLVGRKGGLFIVAGCSPSNHEGWGQPSSLYAIYDVARGKYFTGTLPAITGSGTSAAFHDGKVFIKRGGLNFAAYNSELWIVEPVSHMKAWRAEARLERERMSLKKVDFLSLQFDSNGHEAFTIWIDGLEFGG